MSTQAALPHPTRLESAAPADFRTVEFTRTADPDWHFRIAARAEWRLAPSSAEGPAPGAPASLALFKMDLPARADIEVTGHAIEREVDPADWLDEVMRLEERQVISRHAVRVASGVAGDVVATWRHEGEELAGRFFAVKWGPRLFLVAVRARAADYPAVAEHAFLSIASLEPVDDSKALLAEPVKVIEDSMPVDWKAVIPDAWRVRMDENEAPIGSFQAMLVRGYDLSTVDGRLSFGVMLRSAAKKPRDAANRFLDAVREEGIQLDNDHFEPEEARSPFERSWYFVGKGARGGKEAEVRCRVMMHPTVWAVAGVIGPLREHDVVAWMENKRALDVVTGMLKLKV
jgi:hypothetical protein